MSHAHDAPVAPYEADDKHVQLQQMIGEWSGSTTTWFDPTAAPEESAWQLTGSALLGGRFVELEYRGTAMGKPHAGRMLFGADKGVFTLHWIDSFHTGTMAMAFEDERSDDGGMSFRGSWAYETEVWGWRIVVRAAPMHLHVDHYNISPQGEVFRALETRLIRE